MSNITRKIWLRCGLLPVLALAFACNAAAQTVPSGEWGMQDLPAREKIRQRYFPNVELTTQDGKTVRFYEDLMKDKIVIINFFYANCEGVCPGIVANLRKVKKLLGARVGKDIFFYSFTLKPEEDTPEVLHHYAEMNKLGPGWTLLTGNPQTLELLRQRLGFVDPDPEADKDKSSHIGNVRIGNEPLMFWTASPGLSRPEGLVRVISYIDWPAKQAKQPRHSATTAKSRLSAHPRSRKVKKSGN